MPDRYKTNETLMAATREKIPAAAIDWLAAVRRPLEKLTRAALSGDVTDAEFRAMVEQFSASLPGLMGDIDHTPIATLMEHSMGAAMANGLTARSPKEIKAKLPWQTEAWLAAQKRRKNGQFGEGDGSLRKPAKPIELGQPWQGTRDQMKARAMDAMKKIKTMQHPESKAEMQMNGEARKKSLIQAKTPADFMVAANLDSIFLNSRKNPPEPDTKNRPDTKAFHTFDAKVRIGRADHNVRITAIERPGNDALHFKLIHIRRKKTGT
jgi:hypothetical protein